MLLILSIEHIVSFRFLWYYYNIVSSWATESKIKVEWVVGGFICLQHKQSYAPQTHYGLQKKKHTIPKHINECLKVHCKIGEKYIKRWWWSVSVILIRIRNKRHIILCLYACIHHNLTSVDLRRIKYIICCEGFLFEKVLVWVRSQYMLSVSGQIIPNGDDRRT